jgi:opacity protein-like surface antigen
MRKGILSVAAAGLCVFAVNAEAIGNGFYMGVMAGPARSNAPTLQAIQYPPPDPGTCNAQPCPTAIYVPMTPLSPKSNQFASRIFIGNKFNPYAAIEGGVTFWSSIRYQSKENIETFGSTDQRVRDLDVVGKFSFPVRSFEIYGKLGVAVVYITKGGAFNPTFQSANPPSNNRGTFHASSTYKNKFAPTYSLGASYDIDQSWVADLSWNGLSVGSSVGTLSFIALGIAYHFTDKYCGQFLCDD